MELYGHALHFGLLCSILLCAAASVAPRFTSHHVSSDLVMWDILPTCCYHFRIYSDFFGHKKIKQIRLLVRLGEEQPLYVFKGMPARTETLFEGHDHPKKWNAFAEVVASHVDQSFGLQVTAAAQGIALRPLEDISHLPSSLRQVVNGTVYFLSHPKGCFDEPSCLIGVIMKYIGLPETDYFPGRMISLRAKSSLQEKMQCLERDPAFVASFGGIILLDTLMNNWDRSNAQNFFVLQSGRLAALDNGQGMQRILNPQQIIYQPGIREQVRKVWGVDFEAAVFCYSLKYIEFKTLPTVVGSAVSALAASLRQDVLLFLINQQKIESTNATSCFVQLLPQYYYEFFFKILPSGFLDKVLEISNGHCHLDIVQLVLLYVQQQVQVVRKAVWYALHRQSHCWKWNSTNLYSHTWV